MFGLSGLLTSCYVLGVPVAALVTCLLCRRHRVLLWLGGLLLIPSGLHSIGLGLSLWSVYVGREHGRHQSEGSAMLAALVLPVLVASIILLVGGLVRWDRVRSERRRVAAP